METDLNYRKIPHKDLIWASTQPPSVMKLFFQCWICAPEGNGRWMVLNHDLSNSAFRKAKKVLHNQRLFAITSDRSIRDARETVCLLVANLEGIEPWKLKQDLGTLTEDFLYPGDRADEEFDDD